MCCRDLARASTANSSPSSLLKLDMNLLFDIEQTMLSYDILHRFNITLDELREFSTQNKFFHFWFEHKHMGFPKDSNLDCSVKPKVASIDEFINSSVTFVGSNECKSLCEECASSASWWLTIISMQWEYKYKVRNKKWHYYYYHC